MEPAVWKVESGGEILHSGSSDAKHHGVGFLSPLASVLMQKNSLLIPLEFANSLYVLTHILLLSFQFMLQARWMIRMKTNPEKNPFGHNLITYLLNIRTPHTSCNLGTLMPD